MFKSRYVLDVCGLETKYEQKVTVIQSGKLISQLKEMQFVPSSSNSNVKLKRSSPFSSCGNDVRNSDWLLGRYW